MFFLVVLAAGCADVPRDNPLDPLSPGYNGQGALSGTVVLKLQGTPIPLARVSVPEAAVSVATDSLGHFIVSRLPAGTWTVISSQENFTPDTEHVSLPAGGAQSLTISLNGAPTVLSDSILTRKIDQYYPSAQYYVDVSARVTDPNGISDLDSVWFSAGSVLYPMAYDPSLQQYLTRVFKYDIPTNTIQWLVGRPLFIVSRDRSGAVNTSDPFYVSRVIETGATPVYPSSLNNDTTGGVPLLKWLAPDVTFAFTYTLTISRDDAGTQTVVWQEANVNSLLTQYQYPAGATPLDPGIYVWSVTVVDEFGNFCRSKESSFVVQ